MIRNVHKLLKAAMMAGLSLTSGATMFQGCGGDLAGFGYGYDDLFGDIYSNPYFPSYESSWASYSTDASLYWADQWDAYIRE